MNHPFSRRRLGDILVDKYHVSTEDINSIVSEGEGNLGEMLVKTKQITQTQLAEALAEQFQMTYVDLDDFTVPPELFTLIPASEAYRNKLIPYSRDNGVLKVAISDPRELHLADDLERLCGMPVELVISGADAIAETLKRSEGTSEVLKGVTEDFKLVIIKEGEDGQEQTVSLDKADDEDSPVIKLVNTIVIDALQRRASDIHIEAYEKGILVKYRIDGVLYSATETLDLRHHSALVSRLKVMAELDIAERRVPQDGRFKLRLNRRDIDFRVSILPSVFGEDVVIRILDKTSISQGVKRLSLDDLGIDPRMLKKFRRSILEPYGMVLITGPTGSGKTTTLYAALSELNHGEEKIITIEDPVEYQLDGVVQIPVNEKKNLTFAKGLRSILRHDPDKIMVGEIRDSETVQIAVQSALTGHLVFTTVHANSAFDVLGRFSHMGVDLHSFVSALNCVVAQRLVRKICPDCKQETHVSDELLEASGLDVSKYRNNKWFHGKGCSHCSNTGYRGRSAITEFLELSPTIRELITQKCSFAELEAVAVKEGLVTLRQSAIAKAIAGETTLQEINRVTFIE